MEKKERRAALALSLLCSVLALTVATTSSPLYATNFWTDSNLYFTIGRGMLEGLMPYRDLFDHKGPLIFLLYALGALVSDTSFFGVFLLDVAHSAQLVVKLKAYAEDNDVIVRYEALKAHIRQRREEMALRYHFFRPFRSDLPLKEHLRQMQETLETRIRRK